MKNLWKSLSKYMLVAAAATMLTPGARAETSDPDQLAELTWVEMINSVDPGKSADLIRQFQEKEARGQLLRRGSPYVGEKNKCKIENYRRKEVILITIPAEYLFGPNETTLKEGAAKYLEPIKRYLKNPDMWRVMLVMHTDNTGSPQYRDNLTENRVLSINEWFEEQTGIDTSYLFPYSLSDDVPLNDNNSMLNRANNRRLEIYLVPGEKMVNMAHKGRIAY